MKHHTLALADKSKLIINSQRILKKYTRGKFFDYSLCNNNFTLENYWKFVNDTVEENSLQDNRPLNGVGFEQHSRMSVSADAINLFWI